MLAQAKAVSLTVVLLLVVLVVSLLNLGLKLGEKPVTETLLLTTTERATETSTAVLTSTKLTVETVTQKELTTIVAPPTTVTLTSTRYETVTTTTTLPPLTITMTATAPPVTVTTTATQYITRILITTTTTTATTTLPAGPFTYAEKVRLSGVTVEDAGSGYYNIRGRATNISNQTISNLYIFAFVYDETGKLTNDPRWQNAKLEDMLPGDTMTFKISLVNIEKGWRLELLAVA